MTALVKGSGCLLVAPASVLTMLSKFQVNHDKNFGGKTIRIVKPDRINKYGKEVGGCFAWLDVVSAVLPGHVIGIDADIAPSLGFVDNGFGRQVAVVHPSDMEEIFTRHMEKTSVVPVQCVQGGVGGVAGAVQGGAGGVAGAVQGGVGGVGGAMQGGAGGVAGAMQAVTNHTEGNCMLAMKKNTSTSTMRPENAFVVDSKDHGMYGRFMRDVNIGGFSVLSDAVIRFRAKDHKPLTGDLLVAVGRYVKVYDAQEAIKKMVARKDHKVNDLQSIEFDNKLTEDPVCHLFYIGINNGGIVC